MTIKPVSGTASTLPYRLTLDIRALDMTEEQFLKLCSDNRHFRLELTAKRELIIMPPTGSTAGGRNSDLNGFLFVWSRQDGTGKTFDSSTGFTLPNGSIVSPDASWILLSRWQALTEEEQERFAPICPDFVIELRSPSDNLPDIQGKMEEYIENGVRLGWLIDPRQRRVYIYQPGETVQVLEDPANVSGDPELSGFNLDMREIWGAVGG